MSIAAAVCRLFIQGRAYAVSLFSALIPNVALPSPSFESSALIPNVALPSPSLELSAWVQMSLYLPPSMGSSAWVPNVALPPPSIGSSINKRKRHSKGAPLNSAIFPPNSAYVKSKIVNLGIWTSRRLL